VSTSEPSVFTRIINGEISGDFVYRDDLCVALLTTEPIAPGHTVIIPIQQIDDWWKLPDSLLAHLMQVSKQVSNALLATYDVERIGVMVAGFQVPHAHLHLVPASNMNDLDLRNGKSSTPDLLASEALKIKQHLA
jgi:diadenosine tetraphosphate (Ap4A) HIT family hydrolase